MCVETLSSKTKSHEILSNSQHCNTSTQPIVNIRLMEYQVSASKEISGGVSDSSDEKCCSEAKRGNGLNPGNLVPRSSLVTNSQQLRRKKKAAHKSLSACDATKLSELNLELDFGYQFERKLSRKPERKIATTNTSVLLEFLQNFREDITPACTPKVSSRGRKLYQPKRPTTLNLKHRNHFKLRLLNRISMAD